MNPGAPCCSSGTARIPHGASYVPVSEPLSDALKPSACAGPSHLRELVGRAAGLSWFIDDAEGPELKDLRGPDELQANAAAEQVQVSVSTTHEGISHCKLRDTVGFSTVQCK